MTVGKRSPGEASGGHRRPRNARGGEEAREGQGMTEEARATFNVKSLIIKGVRTHHFPSGRIFFRPDSKRSVDRLIFNQFFNRIMIYICIYIYIYYLN